MRLPSSTLPSQVQPGIASQVAYSVRKSKAAGTRARSQLPRYAFLVDRNRFISAVYSRSHSLCLCFCAVVRLWRRRCTRSWRRLSARLDSRSEHVAAAILAAAMVMAVVRSCTMRRTSQSVACSAVRVAGSRQCRLDVFCLCPSLRRVRSLRCGAAGRVDPRAGVRRYSHERAMNANENQSGCRCATSADSEEPRRAVGRFLVRCRCRRVLVHWVHALRRVRLGGEELPVGLVCG